MAASSRDTIVNEEEEQDDTPDYSEDSLRQKTTVTAIGKVSFSQFMKDILPGLQLPKTVLDKLSGVLVDMKFIFRIMFSLHIFLHIVSLFLVFY